MLYLFKKVPVPTLSAAKVLSIDDMFAISLNALTNLLFEPDSSTKTVTSTAAGFRVRALLPKKAGTAVTIIKQP